MADMSGDFQILPQQQNQRLSFTKVPKAHGVAYASIFLAIIISCFGGMFYYRQKLIGQIVAVDAKLQTIQDNRDPVNETKLLTIQRQLSVFGSLLNSHVYWSQGLAKLFKLVKPQVHFQSLTVDSLKGTASFNAYTDSYDSISQQLNILYNSKEVKDVSFGGMSVGTDGRVNFSISLTLNLQSFIYK